MTPRDYLKLLFRFLHITYSSLRSGVYVAGNLASDYFYGEREGQTWVYCGMYTVVLIAGVVNTILLQPSRIFEGEGKEFWKTCMYVKFALLLFLSPFLNLILSPFSPSTTSYSCLRFLLVLITLGVSCVAKQYRDRNSIKPLASSGSS